MQITRRRGDTYPDVIKISAPSGGAADLTGCTVVMTLNSKKEPPDDTTQVYQLMASIADPLSGIVEFAPNSTQADLVGFYYFDIQMTDMLGVIRTIQTGTYEYKQDITKL